MPKGVSKLQLLIDLKNKLKMGLDSAKKQVEKATGGMQKKLDAFKAKNIELFNSIKDQVPGVSNALSLIANPYVLITAAVLTAGAAIVKFTGMANQWREKLAEVNVTAGLTDKELDALSGKLLEIGSRNVAPLEEVPVAFNRIISAGLDVNRSLKTLEPTLRAAKAGFTDIETVASAGVSVMMSAGKDAAKVYDVLFATVKEGNANFRDIASYLPKVIPLARNVGFALEETAGTFASLTGKFRPEQATTALEGILRSLSDKNIVKNFEGLDIQIFDKDTNQVRPILDIIKDLNKQMTGLSDKQRMLKFGSLGLDQTSAAGFATLMQDIQALQKAIDATVNSQGALEKAYKDSLTPMENWRLISNALKAEAIKIGEKFLPVVSMIGEKVLGVITFFKDLYKESALFRDILSAIGLVFVVAFKMISAPVKMVINFFKMLFEIGSWINDLFTEWLAKITGIEGGFKGMYDKIRPYLVWIYDFIKQIVFTVSDLFSGNWRRAWNNVANFKLPNIEDIKRKIKVETEADPNGDFSGVPVTDPAANNSTSTDTTVSSDAEKIKNGSQTKSTIINIDSFIKGFNPTHQSINNMNKDELERWLTDMFMRVVRSAETA